MKNVHVYMYMYCLIRLWLGLQTANRVFDVPRVWSFITFIEGVPSRSKRLYDNYYLTCTSDVHIHVACLYMAAIIF